MTLGVPVNIGQPWLHGSLYPIFVGGTHGGRTQSFMAAAATLAVSFQKHATWRENRPRLCENFHWLAIPIPEMLRFRRF